MGFYFPERDALGNRAPSALDADADWHLFTTGAYIWILQTYLRLEAAAASVRLLETMPRKGIVVVHADHLGRALAEAPTPSKIVVVGVRADRRPQRRADVEIVQNLASAGRRQIMVPSWLQPGLIPRDRRRGASVRVVAYLGDEAGLDPSLADPAWSEALEREGLQWEPRTARFTASDRSYGREVRWNDYANVDVVVALRPRTAWGGHAKPAAKLQNAWAAGVPALLSPETPYRELRRSPLDYLEVRSSAEVLAALRRLRREPGLYDAMVENGLARARAFSTERLIARWLHVLERDVPECANALVPRALRAARPLRSRLGRPEPR